jgi:hypothetical protein
MTTMSSPHAPPPRKKIKTSDLPLASATRAAIEGLAHTFKKKGGYDSLRKQVWEEMEGSVCFGFLFLLLLRNASIGWKDSGFHRKICAN